MSAGAVKRETIALTQALPRHNLGVNRLEACGRRSEMDAALPSLSMISHWRAGSHSAQTAPQNSRTTKDTKYHEGLYQGFLRGTSCPSWLTALQTAHYSGFIRSLPQQQISGDKYKEYYRDDSVHGKERRI